MESSTGSIAELSKSIAAWSSLMLVSVMGWLGRRQLKRIDRIEKNYVNKPDLDKKLDYYISECKQSSERISKSIDTLSIDLRETRKRIDRVLETKADK